MTKIEAIHVGHRVLFAGIRIHAAATEGRAERGIVDRDQRPQAARRILCEQQRLMAVVVGVAKHLLPCRRRAADEGKRHETRSALRRSSQSARQRHRPRPTGFLAFAGARQGGPVIFHLAPQPTNGKAVHSTS
jgi:hypothetical protein